jgi:hypothetical protein
MSRARRGCVPGVHPERVTRHYCGTVPDDRPRRQPAASGCRGGTSRGTSFRTAAGWSIGAGRRIGDLVAELVEFAGVASPHGVQLGAQPLRVTFGSLGALALVLDPLLADEKEHLVDAAGVDIRPWHCR